MRCLLPIAIAVVVPVSLQAQERTPTPAEVWQLAAADLQTVEPGLQPFCRYLSLAAVLPKDREQWTKVLAYHCNALSTESDVVAPSIVAQGAMLRITLRDYAWSSSLWESLSNVEPYYHVRLKAGTPGPIRVWWNGGKWAEYGQQDIKAGLYTIDRPCKTDLTAIAPWLAETPEGINAVKALINGTQSGCPVVDGRWFLWQTAIQADRGKTGYYEWLGIKKKADFDALVGYDAKLAAKARRVELLEAVADSAVTLQPRRIGVFPAIDGKVFETFDSRQAIDDHNPLRCQCGYLRR